MTKRHYELLGYFLLMAGILAVWMSAHTMLWSPEFWGILLGMTLIQVGTFLYTTYKKEEK